MKSIWILMVASLTANIVLGQKNVKVNADHYKETKYVNTAGTEDGAYQMKTKKGRTGFNIRKLRQRGKNGNLELF